MEAQLKACIIQSDRSILLEVDCPGSELARDALAGFAELEKSPEHIHTYRISPLSLWNAAAAGLSSQDVVTRLRAHARYGVPPSIIADVHEFMGRFGKLRLLPGRGDELVLEVDDPNTREEIHRAQGTAPIVRREGNVFYIDTLQRGTIKQRLARLGYPVDDRAGFVEGEAVAMALRETTLAGKAFALRDYQREAVHLFVTAARGHGVLVLPCGSGKTVVGMGIMAKLRCATLILCPNITAARQWIQEILDKTTLTADQVGEYSGQKKQIRDVTVATYQILSRRQGQQLSHFDLFTSRGWGALIYDEVHLLPAPMFRVTAEIQARRRIGLTATLVREDGLETDVFALIGPKRFDVPWKDMEKRGFIAQAHCHEVRVALSGSGKVAYAACAETPQMQYRVAAENPRKEDVAATLVQKHRDERILVIGQYLRQLERLSKRLEAPMITGATPQGERERLYAAFRDATLRVLVVSKVANFSVDLPDASVCIQVSGSFGSRQEEAQRLGRILRPKARDAFFYSIVSQGTSEMRFALNRQMFLTEQGYRYYIEDWHEAPKQDAN